MWMPKEIHCPICGSVISKMGGGFAGHWGVDKCDTCGNWIDFDAERLAYDTDVPNETSNVVEDTLSISVDELPEGFIVGEVRGDDADIEKYAHGGVPQFTFCSHHATSEGVASMVAGIKEAFQPQIDSDNRLNELIKYYAARHGLSFLLSKDVTERAKNCDLDLPEFDDITAAIAHKVVCMQKEIENKDKLIELYKKQDEARKKYQASIK